LATIQYSIIHFHELVARRDHLEAEFARANRTARYIEVERSNPDLPALIYRGDPLEWLRKTRELYQPPPPYRTLSPAEIANAASHLLALRGIEADWGVILEDDVLLEPQFFSTAEQRLQTMPAGIGCVFLGGGFPHQQVTHSIAEFADFHLKAHPATNTIVAYAVRAPLARRIVHDCRGVDLPFDFELSYQLMARNALVAHLLPYIAREGSKTGAYVSAIESARRG
jgi:GR25 family glycosyltransferase involved in LPS biosynthesis